MTESRELGAAHWKRVAARREAALSEALRGLLACPDDDAPLEPAGTDSADFRCPACGRTYPTTDGWLRARPSSDQYMLSDADIAALAADPASCSPADADPARLYAPFWDRAAREMGDPRGRRVLDLGCGTGWAAGWFAARGAGVAAVDIVARPDRCAAGDGAIGWFQADACRLPFKPASFDIVFIASLLHTLRRPERALLEVLRVLALGGVVVNLGEAVGRRGVSHGIGGRDPRREGRSLTLSDFEAMYHEAGLSFEAFLAHESHGRDAGWLARLRRHIVNHASGGDRLFIARRARELDLSALRIPWRKGTDTHGG